MKRSEELHPAVVSLKRTLAGLRAKGSRGRKRGRVNKELNAVIRKMPLFPDQFLYVYDYTEGRMLCARGFLEVLGYPDEEVDADLLFAIYHPDDASLIARINERAIRAMAGLRGPLDPFQICLTVDYRVRKASGSYIKILRQTALFEIDEDTGEVLSTFSMCKDISTIKTSNTIGWQIKGRGSDTVDMSGLAEHPGGLVYRPSIREMDIIRKLAEGKSSKDIARDLRISLHTVNTHRRNLLMRTGLKNSPELVRYVSEAGWL